MHPRDAWAEDVWHLTPGSVVTAYAAGRSLSAERREAYPGQTDAAIGDEAMGDPWVGYAATKIGPSKPGAAAVNITVDGFCFDGLDNNCTIYPGTTETDVVRAVGSVDGFGIVSATGADGTEGWGGRSYPAHAYTWDARAVRFCPAESISPRVWGRFRHLVPVRPFTLGEHADRVAAPDGSR